MSIDIHTISLIFGLTVLIEVVILYIQFQKGKNFPGFNWLILGITTIGSYFIILFVQEFVYFGNFAFILEDIVLTASGLFLTHGIMDFYHVPTKGNKHPTIFVVVYALIILISSILTKFTVLNSFSALSMAGFSIVIAIFVLKQKSHEDRPFRHFIGIAFAINALFFLIHAITWLALPQPDLANLPTLMQTTSYFRALHLHVPLDFWLRLSDEHPSEPGNHRGRREIHPHVQHHSRRCAHHPAQGWPFY